MKTALAVILLLAVAAYPVHQKIRSQNADRAVEICVPFQETFDFLKTRAKKGDALGQTPMVLFLERLRLMGVSSVSLREETLKLWIERGDAVFLGEDDRRKFELLGISERDLPFKNQIVIRNSARAETVRQAVAARRALNAADIKMKKAGKLTLIENPGGDWDEDLDLHLGFNPEELKILSDASLSAVYAAEETGKGAFPLETQVAAGSAPIGAWIFTGIPETSAKASAIASPFQAGLKASSSAVILFENVNAPLIKRLGASLDLKDRIVKGHTVPPDELRSVSKHTLSARFVRAVRERSCRFLYFRWNPEIPVDENLAALRTAAQELKAKGYAFKKIDPAGSPAVAPLLRFRLATAFCLAVLGPLCGVWGIREALRKNLSGWPAVFLIWGFSAGAAALFGISIYLLLPDGAFLNGLATFKGVKMAMVLPLFFSIWILFSREERAEMLNYKISLLGLLLFAAAGAALAFAVQRSGNFAGGVTPPELAFRHWIESLLAVRPRFKEFAVGHPLLILGIYLAINRVRGARLAILGGSIGLISIVNTFCHLHTPLQVSLIRTLHGAWLGAILGLCAVFIFNSAFKRLAARREVWR